MTSDWDARTVQSLERDGVLKVEDGNHGDYRPRRDEFAPDGTAFIRAANISAARVDLEGADRINDAALARIRKGIGAPDDVLLTHKGTVGRVARVPSDAPPFVCSPQTTLWRVLDPSRLDRDYLTAFLKSPQFGEQLYSRMHGSDMAPYVSLTEQRTLTVQLPPIEEQRAIGATLSRLDDKIESNRQIAAILEEIAATLFKARFVDFIDHDELVEIAIGPIPPGWVAEPVASLAQFVNGKAFTRHGNGRGRMVIRIADLRSGPSGSTVYTDYETEPEYTAFPGDILFAWSGSLDVYRWHREEALINQHIFKVIPTSPYPGWFVYLALKHLMPQFQAIAADKATTMGHIKRSHLHEHAVAVPPTEELEKHSAVFQPLFDRVLAAQVELETLTRARDALLPRLVSGQIRVPPDAFPEAEAA